MKLATRWKRIVILLSLFIGKHISALGVVPSLSPLQYITFPVVATYVFEKAQNAVWGALLPIDQEDAVAIFISEGVSGFLGGVAGRTIAIIDGNKNEKDSSIVSSAGTSGAYFGVAGAVRSLANIAGLSSLSVSLLAFGLAAGFSEIFKLRSQNILMQRTRVANGPTMYDLMRFKEPSMRDMMRFYKEGVVKNTPRMPMLGQMTQTEVIADAVRWFIVYLFLPPLTQDVGTSLENSTIIGFIAGIIYQLVRERRDRELELLNVSVRTGVEPPFMAFESDGEKEGTLEFSFPALFGEGAASRGTARDAGKKDAPRSSITKTAAASSTTRLGPSYAASSSSAGVGVGSASSTVKKIVNQYYTLRTGTVGRKAPRVRIIINQQRPRPPLLNAMGSEPDWLRVGLNAKKTTTGGSTRQISTGGSVKDVGKATEEEKEDLKEVRTPLADKILLKISRKIGDKNALALLERKNKRVFIPKNAKNLAVFDESGQQRYSMGSSDTSMPSNMPMKDMKLFPLTSLGLFLKKGSKDMEKASEKSKNRPDFIATRLSRAGLEGAAQLLTYQAARTYVREVSPYFKDLAAIAGTASTTDSSSFIGGGSMPLAGATGTAATLSDSFSTTLHSMLSFIDAFASHVSVVPPVEIF